MEIKFRDNSNPNIIVYDAISSSGVSGKIRFAKLDNESVVISRIDGFASIPTDVKKTLEAMVRDDFDARFPKKEVARKMSDEELAEIDRKNQICETIWSGEYDNE